MIWKQCFLLAATCLQAFILVDAYYDRQAFKSLVYDDHSNDDAIHMTAEQLVERSGYRYENHYTIADDGYISSHIRIVNPRVKAEDLRYPPVMLYHGANIDQSAYIMSSSIQHHPEKWPRVESDGPITSFNRSLGFMLANNGYDVWLMGQRGSNRKNQAFTNEPPHSIRYLASQPGFTLTGKYYQLIDEHKKQYWSYGLDDIIQYEIKAQIDTVLSVTGASEVSMLTFSLSTPTTMAFLAANPDYAHRVRTYFQMAPAIAADHFTFLDKLYFEKICPYFPTRGIGFTPTYKLKPAVRKLIIQISKSNRVRYSLVYRFVTALFGPSLKYQANLERNVLAHVFQPVSFKSVKHYCQNSLTKSLTAFDYGSEKNTETYDQSVAPAYDISRLEVPNWIVISGTYDGLADATTVQRLIEKTNTPKPPQHIICPGFNHVDFLAAVENDKYTNLPILDILNASAGDTPKDDPATSLDDLESVAESPADV